MNIFNRFFVEFLETTQHFFLSWSTSWLTVLPEIMVSAGLLLMMIVNLFQTNTTAKRTNVWLMLFILLLCALSIYGLLHLTSEAFVLDLSGVYLKFLILAICVLIILYNADVVKNTIKFQAEFFYFFLFIIIGNFLMIDAHNVLMLYLGIELTAMATYACVGMDKDNKNAPEVALKYFVLGAVVSSIMLFGASLMYGAVGVLNFELIQDALLNLSDAHALLFNIGLGLFLLGILFKLGAAPLHIWMPDVYTGASLSSLNIIASVNKIGAFGALIALWPILSLMTNDANTAQHVTKNLLYLVIIASIVWGNLAALYQNNLKKLLAYSSIANIGFLLLCLDTVYNYNSVVSLVHGMLYYGLQPTLFIEPIAQNAFLAGKLQLLLPALLYVSVYALTMVFLIGVLMNAIASKTNYHINDLSGLGKRHPMLAVILSIAVFSLLGLPPTLGFFAKFFVFVSLVKAQQFLLLFFGIAGSIIAAVYYLKIIKTMWFEPINESVKITKNRSIFISNTLAVLLLLSFIFVLPIFSF